MLNSTMNKSKSTNDISSFKHGMNDKKEWNPDFENFYRGYRK